MRHSLETAVKTLAAVCDGAREHDAQGFNGTDAPFGNRLAALPPEHWTPAMKREAWEMLAKYRTQLARFGIAYDVIPEPPPVEADAQREARQDARLAVKSAQAEKRIILATDLRTGELLLAVKFEYDPRLVGLVRNIPGRKWDPANKHWTVPLQGGSVDALDALAAAEGFQVAADANEEMQPLRGEPAPPAPFDGLDLDESGFTLRFPYDKQTVESLKLHVPKRAWDGKTGCWRVPIEPGTARQLAEWVAQQQIPQTEPAAKMLHRLTVEMAARLEASSSAAAELVVEGIGGTLRPFQAAGVIYLARVGRGFCADEMGLGKTVQALVGMHHVDAYPFLVLCPASLKLNWQREARKWLPGKRVLVCTSRTTAAELAWADIAIANYDITKVEIDKAHPRAAPTPIGLTKLLLERGFKGIVADESHYLKNTKAQRTKAAKLLAKGLRYRFLLSGTPLTNRPKELIAQLQILDRLGDLGGYQRFTNRYCNARETRWGHDTSGAGNLLELNELMRATCYVRRLKRDVLKELPEKQRTEIPVEIANRKEYEKAERDLIAWLIESADDETRDQKIAAALRAEQLVRISALKQLAAKGKLAAAQQWVKEFLETDEKLILFGWHREVVNTLARTFNAPSITGDTPLHERQENVDRFQNDPDCRLICCNIKAAGVGLTLTAASNVAFLELGWTPAEHDQAEDRAHRIGQEADSVNAWYLIGERTIDEDIYELIEQKRAVVTAAADGEEYKARRQRSVLQDVVKRLRKKAREAAMV